MNDNQANQPPAAPDIQALLAELDQAVREKTEQGFYDPEEIRRVEQAAVSFDQPPESAGAQASEDGAAAELSLRQGRLEELWDPKAWGVATHRGGIAGRLLIIVKKIIYKLAKFPASVILARQTSFNDELVQLLKQLLPRHTDLRYRMAHNETRLDAAIHQRLPKCESRLDMLEERDRRSRADLDWLRDQLVRWKELKGEFRENDRVSQARIQALEREAYKDRPQMEALLARLERVIQEQAQAGAPAADVARQASALRQQNRGAAYLAFEDIHRGEREVIKERQKVYLPYFQDGVSDQAPLLDIGCGRGEFLEAAREAGLKAMGLDINPDTVAVCRERGLDVVEADALEYMRGLEDDSLGGVLMAQVIEHLTLDQLMELVSLCALKLKPGGAFIAETVNPQCLTTFSGAFYLDLTHNKPIHPEAARFLWRWAGLGDVEIMYLSPYPDEHLLEMAPAAEAPGGPAGRGPQATAEALNRNMQRLNQLLFSFQDYAVAGRK